MVMGMVMEMEGVQTGGVWPPFYTRDFGCRREGATKRFTWPKRKPEGAAGVGSVVGSVLVDTIATSTCPLILQLSNSPRCLCPLRYCKHCNQQGQTLSTATDNQVTHLLRQ